MYWFNSVKQIIENIAWEIIKKMWSSEKIAIKVEKVKILTEIILRLKAKLVSYKYQSLNIK